jgi:hypothetical protein
MIKFGMPMWHFSSVSALFEKDGFKSTINRRMNSLVQRNIGNYWQPYEAMLVP